MINWLHLAFNTLWILGLVIILASFSYTRWLAQVQGVRTRQQLSTPTFQLPFTLGLMLLSTAWLERGLWAAFTLLFAWQLWGAWRGRTA
jgi:hypothetical protein